MRIVELDIPAIDVVVRRMLNGSNLNDITRHDRSLLAEFRMHKWRGATIYGAEVPCEACEASGLLDGEQCDDCLGEGELVVALCAVGYGKRPKERLWGPYVNLYTLFSDPCYRGRGYMRALIEYALVLGQASGCTRVKSLASTEHSLRLYTKMGLRTWGRNHKGEVVVDAPLGIEPTQLKDKIPPTVVLT